MRWDLKLYKLLSLINIYIIITYQKNMRQDPKWLDIHL